MHLRNGWLAVCEVFYASQIFRGSFAAVLKQSPTEVPLLTGVALSEAINKIQSNPAINWTLPNLHPTNLTKRANQVCDNVYICNRAYIAARFLGATVATTALLEQANAYQQIDYAVYYTSIESILSIDQGKNIDLPGEIAQSFYNTVASNSYALVGTLIAQGSLQMYLQLTSNIYLNAVFSLENLNAILPYCGDGTYDALASRLAYIVEGFISQYTPSAHDTDISITVASANVDTDTGKADGISLGGSFLWASSEQKVSATCPVFGDVF